jgi:hypothetical protein
VKKLFIFSAAGIIIAASVNAQTNIETLSSDVPLVNKNETSNKKEKKEERKELRKLKGQEVTYQSREAFYKDFGDVPVSKAERTTNFDKFTFTKNGLEMTAYYDIESNLVGTVSPKAFSDLPASAQKLIQEKYKDYTAGSVIFFDDNELNETDMILFGTQFDDADNYFVELKKENKNIIVQVTMNGTVEYFSAMR